MNKSILSLFVGLILIIVCSNQLLAQGLQDNSLLKKYMRLGDSNKITVLMNASQQNFSIEELVNRVKNSSALTVSEKSVYQDMLKDISLHKATEFFNIRTNLYSVQNTTSGISTMAKSSTSGQFLLTEYEYLIDFGGGFGWHTLDKYSYDNNQNMIQWVNQNYDSSAGWMNSSLMLFYYDSFNRDTLEVNQVWDALSLSWVNYGKWPTTYDASNNPTNTLRFSWEDPNWVLSGRRLYTFDANNNFLEVLTQTGEGPDWVNDSRETYSYDVNNNLLTDIYDTWNGTAWQEFTKTENTYDANNNLNSYIFSIFGNYSGKDIYTYDSNDNQISDSNYTWNSTSNSWVISFIQTNTYDAMNNQIHYLVEQSNGSNLEDYLQYEATFNSSNKIIGWHIYIWDSNSWVLDSKGDYSYDSDQNNTLYTDSTTRDGGLTWKLFSLEAWTWSAAVTEVEGIENNIPTNFSLAQNYPNPFNPRTKILWQLPISSQVTLKIYDVLGREVSTLVNEDKPAGKYEIELNANDLPSGVYIYNIQAGSFVESKKMILLK